MNKTMNPTATPSNSTKSCDYLMITKKQYAEDIKAGRDALYTNIRNFACLTKSTYRLGLSQGAVLWIAYSIFAMLGASIVLLLEWTVVPKEWLWVCPLALVVSVFLVARLFNLFERKLIKKEDAAIDELENKLLDLIDKEEKDAVHNN